MVPRALSIPAFVLMIGCVCAAGVPARAQTDNRDALLLLQRLANAGPQATVTIDALPPGWTPTVPLPAAPIVGSVATLVSTGGPIRFLQIYYRPADAKAAFDTYSNQLKDAGFAAYMQPSTTALSGFLASAPAPSALPPGYASFCKDGQRIQLSRSTVVNDDLRMILFVGTAGQCFATPAPLVRPFSPLPAILPPPGDTIQPQGTSTISAGLAGGATESITSVATINGPADLSTVFGSIVSQLKAGGWSVASRLMSRDVAIAKLDFLRGSEQWKANLYLVQGANAQSYSAHLDMVKAGLQNYRGAAAMQMGMARRADFSWVPKTIARSDQPVLLQLVKQLTTFNGYQPAQLYLQKIPPGFDVRVPLPRATPLAGTIIQYQPLLQNQGQHQYNLYYRLSRAQIEEYSQRLQAQGWKLFSPPSNLPTGFQFAYFPMVQTYCSKTLPSVNLTGSTNSTAVTVSVLRIRNAFSCDTMQGLPAGQPFPNPLPRLEAPPGTSMLVANAGVRAGNSGAVITTTQPIGTLLDSFNATFTQKGWTLAATTAGPDLASSSYTYTDAQNAGQKWQAVLTLYRSFANAGQYYAFLDLTKLP